MTGKLKSMHGGVMTLTHENPPGSTNPTGDAEYNIQPSAKVTLNGKLIKMGDLVTGDTVSLTGDPASVVTATR